MRKSILDPVRKVWLWFLSHFSPACPVIFLSFSYNYKDRQKLKITSSITRSQLTACSCHNEQAPCPCFHSITWPLVFVWFPVQSPSSPPYHAPTCSYFASPKWLCRAYRIPGPAGRSCSSREPTRLFIFRNPLVQSSIFRLRPSSVSPNAPESPPHLLSASLSTHWRNSATASLWTTFDFCVMPKVQCRFSAFKFIGGGAIVSATTINGDWRRVALWSLSTLDMILFVNLFLFYSIAYLVYYYFLFQCHLLSLIILIFD